MTKVQPKDEYAKFHKKFSSVPSWDWLNKNFKIKIEEDGTFLEQVRGSITEKLDTIARSVIEPIISGGENFCCFYERGMLVPQEKDKMFQIYKQVQSLLWRSNALSVDFSEKAIADWLKEVKDVYDANKEQLLGICNKISDGWKNYKRSGGDTTYHG